MRINIADWQEFTMEWMEWQEFLKQNPSYTNLAIAMREEDKESAALPVEPIAVYLEMAAVLTQWFHDTQDTRHKRLVGQYTLAGWFLSCHRSTLKWQAVRSPHLIHANTLSELLAQLKVRNVLESA